MSDFPCPRCGYDLSGAVASWEHSEPPCCPLAGQCSECGLEFWWVDVMRPWRDRIHGLVEHAQGRPQVLWWSIRTWAMTLAPWRFWKRVRLEAPVVVSLAVLWALIVTVLVWSVGSLLCDVPPLAEWARTRQWPPPPLRVEQFADGWLDPILHIERTRTSWFVTWAFDFRLWVRYFAPLPAMSLAWIVLMLVLRDTTRAARVRRAHIARAAAYSLAWLPALALFHVADGVYLALQYLSTIGAPGLWPVSWNRLPSALLYIWWPPVLLGLSGWLVAWWWFALSTGFRLPRAGMVWSVLVVAAALAWAVAFALCGAATRLIAAYLM